MTAFNPIATALPLTCAPVWTKPLVLATTRDLPDFDGLGCASQGILITRTPFSLDACIAFLSFTAPGLGADAGGTEAVGEPLSFPRSSYNQGPSQEGRPGFLVRWRLTPGLVMEIGFDNGGLPPVDG